MKIQSIFCALFLSIALMLSNIGTAFAKPPMPSGFNGTVKVGGVDVPEGIIITARINGVVYASAEAFFYEGYGVVYAIEVPGDDPESAGTIEGGVEGNIITFYIGDFPADQTGVWHEGTSIDMFNLTAPNPQFALTVSKTGAGSGTVTSAPAGIGCGATCSYSFNTNTSVILTAAPAAGSTFTGWSGSGCSGTSTCVITMDAAKAVTANFDLAVVEYTLTVTSAHGTVTKSPNQPTYHNGDVVTLGMTAVDAGWTFTGWTPSLTDNKVTIDGNTTVTANFALLDTPPTVVSSLRLNVNPTNLSTVQFRVTFSEAVTGVDVADFSLTSTGSIADATVISVSGGGATRAVTVNTGTGSGTLRLDVLNNGTIIDAITNPMSGPTYTGGLSYTVEKTSPTVVSSLRLNVNPTNLSTVQFRVTFSEAVTGVDVADFSLTSTGSIADAAVTSISGGGSTRTVTVNTGTGSGTLRLDVLNNGTIIDAITNPMSGPTYTGGLSYTVEKTSPTVVSSLRLNVNPTNLGTVQFRVTFSEAVTGVDVADFSLTSTGSIADAAVISISGGGSTRTVTVNTGTGSGTIRLNVLNNGTIIDAITNPMSGPTYTGGLSYTVEKTSPTVVSSLRLNVNPTNLSTVQFRVTFSEAVTGVDVADFSLTSTGSIADATVISVSGSGATRAVTVDTGTGSGTLRLDVLNNGTIMDAITNPMSGPTYTGGLSYTVR